METSCPYCRARIDSAGTLAAHEAECAHRAWWAANFGAARAEPSAAPGSTACPFCGYPFEDAEIEAHKERCGQRRWMDHNFAARKSEVEHRKARLPPLELPEAPEAAPGWRSLYQRVARKLQGPDPRYERLRAAFRVVNAIRDDETYNICRRALASVEEVLKTLGEGPKDGGPLPMIAGTAEKLAALAARVEQTLDEIHAIGPARVAKEIGYMENRGEGGPKLAELHGKLERVDALERKAADLRLLAREVAASLEQMRDRILGASPGTDEAILAELEAQVASVENSLLVAPPGASPTREALALVSTILKPRASVELHDSDFAKLSPPSMSFAAASTIGSYRILGLLGTGGMGVVYDARGPTGERVALKTIRASDDEALRDAYERRFAREHKILMGLDHPGCVRLVERGWHGQEMFLAMEFVEGVPLSRLLRERKLTCAELIGLGIELCDALAYLHERGVVHRDLKPDNVMLRRNGAPVITDFGISRMAELTEITDAGGVIGTPGYIAPEVVLGAEVTPLADQWALGRLLFESVASGAPKTGPGSFKTLLQKGLLVDWTRFPATREWGPVRDILYKMLDSEPPRRFPSCVEVAHALSGQARGEAIAPAGIGRIR